MVLQTYQILAEIFSVSTSLHVAGKIKELLHIGLFKYTIGLLGAIIGISFSNFLPILAE